MLELEREVAVTCGIIFEMNNLPANPEGVLPYFDDIDNTRLTKHELAEITDAIENHLPIGIEDAARFVRVDLGHRAQIKAFTRLAISGTLLTMAFASEVTHDVLDSKGDVPPITELPGTADILLQAAYERFMPFGDTGVDTANLGDHIPLMFGTAAVIYTGLAALYEAGEVFYKGSQRNRFDQAQQKAIKRLGAGTFDWRIKQGSTAAFVASGDPFAQLLTNEKPGDIIQFANQPVDGQWVHLPDNASREKLESAYHRADLGNAGELVFLPVKANMEFLPGPDDFEMTVGQMIHHIEAADDIYGAKPVLIIGSKLQAVEYAEATYSTHIPEPETVTIEQKMADLEDKRGEPIYILDQTEIIGDRIIEIADGEPISYFSVNAALATYQERFFATLRDRALGDPKKGEGYRVLYGLKDYTTVNEASGDKDIAIVLDPGEAKKLYKRNMNPDHVLVVADEVLKIAAPYLKGDLQ